MFLKSHQYFLCSILLVFANVADAFDGSNPVFLSAEAPGWRALEIISAEHGTTAGSVSAFAEEGFTWDGNYNKWDGLGAYKHDADTLRVFINHEAGDNSTFTRVDLALSNLQAWIASAQVMPSNPVLKAISRGWVTVGSGTDPINNPCSGNVWAAETFGPGLGFADTLYLTAEETTGGNIWVMDTANRELYEAVDLGFGKWENACPINTGRTDTIALVLSEDDGASTIGKTELRLYVGLKNPSGNFLERNGLTGGTIYYWDPAGASTNGTLNTDPAYTLGIFSAGNGTVVFGTWTTSVAGAALFSKSEDLHVNMNKDSAGYGIEVALASQAEAVLKIDFSSVDFVAGSLGANKDSEISVLFARNTQAAANIFDGFDNLVWSPDGNIYVNEDDGEGDIWLIDVESLEASYASGDYTPDALEVYNIMDADSVEESSGIIDISEFLDYQAGSIFLTNGFSTNTLVNQLDLFISPGAALLTDAYTDWINGFSALDTPAKRLKTADPDADGLSNDLEFALALSPDSVDSSAPVTIEHGASEIDVSFTPARSLNLVNYYLDYTEDLSSGFTQSIAVNALAIDGTGEATITLPKTDQLFVKLRVQIP